MTFADRITGKSQTEQLVKHFLEGRGINFISAFFSLGIQDLHKRLQEVRELGYRLKKLKEDSGYRNGTKLSTWYLADVLSTGDYVRINEAPVFLDTNTSPLKGAIGIIKSFADHEYRVMNFDGATIGRFKHKALSRISPFGHGATVCFKPGAFVVRGFNHTTDTYVLTPMEGEGQPIRVNGTLLESCQAQ